MSFKSWIDLLEKFVPRCPQCNRKFHNRITCQACGTVTCSQNCHSRHSKATHPELIEQHKAEERRRKKAEAEETALASPSRGLHVTCPDCKAELRVPRKLMGKKVPCPHCRFTIRVPEVEIVRPPPDPLPQTPAAPTIDDLEEVVRVEEAAPETPATWADAAGGAAILLVGILMCCGCGGCLLDRSSSVPQGAKPGEKAREGNSPGALPPNFQK